MDKQIFKFPDEFLSSEKEINFRNQNTILNSKPLFIFSFVLTIFLIILDIKIIINSSSTKDFIILLSTKGTLILSLLFISLFLILKSKINNFFIAYSFFIFMVFIDLSAKNISQESDISQVNIYIFISLLFTFYTFFNFKIYSTLSICILSSLIFFISIITLKKPAVIELISICFFIIIANIIGFYTSRKISNLEKKNFQKKIDEKKIINQLLKEKNNVTTLKTELSNEKKEKKIESVKDIFLDVLNQEFERSIRYGNDLSIITMEIDHIEMLNESLGKKVVKALTTNFIQICQGQIRPVGDFFKQTGNNEFTFILPSTDEYGAFSLAERIREKVNKVSYKIDDRKIKISISVGIASINGEKDSSILLKNSKSALILAAKNGRNQSIFYSSN